MSARTAHKITLASALGGLLLATSVGAVSADESFVNPTSVTFNKIAYVNGAASPVVRVSGTMTCDGTGPAVEVFVNITQREATGFSNSMLLDFPCSTEPRTFTISLEGFCDEPYVRDRECFRSGPASIEAFVPGGATLSEQIVLIRPQ
jgi:hypothetical protein